MKVFVLDPHVNEFDNAISITTEIEVEEFVRKDTSHFGIGCGFFTNTDNGTPTPKFFKIFGATAGQKLNNIKVSDMDEHGMRFGSLPAENKSQEEDMAFIYLKANDPNGKARFLKSKELRSQGLLLEGKIFSENTTKEGKPIFSCPAILFAFESESYSFQYWNATTRSLRTVVFHFDGSNLIIDSNTAREFKESTSFRRAIQRGKFLNNTIGSAMEQQAERQKESEAFKARKKQEREEKHARNREGLTRYLEKTDE